MDPIVHFFFWNFKKSLLHPRAHELLVWRSEKIQRSFLNVYVLAFDNFATILFYNGKIWLIVFGLFRVSSDHWYKYCSFQRFRKIACREALTEKYFKERQYYRRCKHEQFLQMTWLHSTEAFLRVTLRLKFSCRCKQMKQRSFKAATMRSKMFSVCFFLDSFINLCHFLTHC